MSSSGVREAVMVLDRPQPETARPAAPISRLRRGRLALMRVWEPQVGMAEASPAPPVIILNAPQLAQNIGAAARVMANFGLAELRLVNPRDGWPRSEEHTSELQSLMRSPYAVSS